MLQNLFKYKVQIAICVLIVGAFALVRAFEEVLFYDPLLQFFKGDYQSGMLPPLDKMKLFVGLLCRYAINALLSLAMIQVIFSDRVLTKFAMMLYIAFFILLTAIFFGLLLQQDVNTLYLFYIRRFLIQPILLLLFIPAFYYQRRVNQPK